jgi:hypothetical protein
MLKMLRSPEDVKQSAILFSMLAGAALEGLDPVTTTQQ